MNKIFFTPGPSALYYTVDQHIKKCSKKIMFPSISHRGKEYMSIHEQTVSNLRTLLNIPDDYSIGFTSSATEVWERTIECLVDEKLLSLCQWFIFRKVLPRSQSLKKERCLQ